MSVDFILMVLALEKDIRHSPFLARSTPLTGVVPVGYSTTGNVTGQQRVGFGRGKTYPDGQSLPFSEYLQAGHLALLSLTSHMQGELNRSSKGCVHSANENAVS